MARDLLVRVWARMLQCKSLFLADSVAKVLLHR